MLEEALALAEELKLALAGEVERSRRERERLVALDPDRIFTGAAERAAFNAEVARLEAALAGALARTAAELGVTDVTLARLAARAPAAAEALSRLLEDVRASAAVLAELDRLNLAVAGRALACVQGYLAALDPSPAAYDRHGQRARGRTSSAHSRKA